MGTPARPRPGAGKRSRGSGRGAEREADAREEQFDLLTAALLGVVVGASATLLLRRGPTGSRPVVPILKAAGRGARWAGKHGTRGARWAAERGEDLWDRVPRDDIREYLDDARSSIQRTVEEELADLRKSIRRQRRKLGI